MFAKKDTNKREKNRKKLLVKLLAVGLATSFGLVFIWGAIENTTEGVLGIIIRLTMAGLGLYLLVTAYKALGD